MANVCCQHLFHRRSVLFCVCKVTQWFSMRELDPILHVTCKCLLQLVVNVSVHLLVHFLYLGTGETELDFITGFLLHALLRAKQRICDFHSGFHVKTVQFFPAQDSVSVPVHQPEKLYRDKKLNSLQVWYRAILITLGKGCSNLFFRLRSAIS